MPNRARHADSVRYLFIFCFLHYSKNKGNNASGLFCGDKNLFLGTEKYKVLLLLTFLENDKKIIESCLRKMAFIFL